MPYKLTATVADNVTDYRTYHVIFHDEMEETLDFSGIEKVTVNGNEVTDYEITSEAHRFDLTLSWTGEEGEKISDENLNKAKVEVYFTAVLNENAVLGAEGNVNTGKLEYSCNPNVDQNGELPEGHEDEETEEETEEDSVIAFTYKVVVNKVDEAGEALEGAEFRLEKKLADGTTETIDQVETAAGSTFTFKGLDDGELYHRDRNHILN